MGYMIGVDVGGTFTDFSVFNQETGELFNYKDSSTPSDPSRAIVKGVQDVLEIKQAGPEAVTYLAHGTTVGTNALIEKKGVRLGLITTKGFKDALVAELGDKVDAGLKSDLEADIAKIKELLKGNDTAAIKAATDAFEQKLMKLGEELYKQQQAAGAAGADPNAGAAPQSDANGKKDDGNVVDAEVVD